MSHYAMPEPFVPSVPPDSAAGYSVTFRVRSRLFAGREWIRTFSSVRRYASVPGSSTVTACLGLSPRRRLRVTIRRVPSLGARRRRPLPRPARPALAVALRSMLAETEAKFASVGPTAEEDIGPALAPHLAKPDRDVDPGSGAGGHGSAVGERPEPSTRINKRRISSGRKRDRGARTWPRPRRRCCTR